jgi:Cdc6-like AAA superfamily ATPase
LRFYEAFANQSTGLCVKRGDIVRVVLDEGEEGEDEADTLAIAQVLAIFINEEDFIVAEVRWFCGPSELQNDVRQKVPQLLPNEIFETPVTQDVAAGSIAQIVSLQGGALPASRKRAAPSSSSSKKEQGTEEDVYHCRFLYHLNEGNTMEPVEMCGLYLRGVMASEYEYAYEHTDENLAGTAPRSDLYTSAAMRLHVSVLPDDLPCRATETETIMSHLRSSIQRRGENKPLYISGLPGTGKTACVLSCVGKLRKEAAAGTLGDFDFVMINALQLQTPADSYSVLLRKMQGVRYTAKSALSRLQSYFHSSGSNAKTEKNRVVLCLVDELDFLMVRNDNVVYNFFDWPLHKDSGLVVVGIANTMDLPERMSTRVLSRLQAGMGLERMVFTPYSFDQITKILTERLESADIFEGKSLNMSARIAAATAGDLRTALKICQRAIEIHRDSLSDEMREVGTTKVSYASVQKSVAEYRATPLLTALVLSCQLDKAIITCICKHVMALGHPSITSVEIFARLHDLNHSIITSRNSASGASSSSLPSSVTGMATAAKAMEDFTMPTMGVFNARLGALSSRGLLARSTGGTMETRGTTLTPSYQLTIAVADVVSTLKDDPFSAYLPRFN